MLKFLEEIRDNKNLKGSFLEEYVKIKQEYPNFIVLYQIGKFYETFFEDAKIVEQILGVVTSTRAFAGEKILQAGISAPFLNSAINTLLNNDYKICLCIEYLDSDNKFCRKLVRKYTKGTLIEKDFLDNTENNYILSLLASNDTCFLSYADVSTGQFYKSMGDFSLIKHEINKILPNEILIPKTQQKIFQELLEGQSVTYLEDDYFSQGVENAILKYCKHIQQSYVIKLDKIIEYKLNNYLLMDNTTRQNLELTRTRRFLKKKGSVFWFLNYTKTPMGARLLKKYISEPLLSAQDINARQKAVEELVSKKDVLEKIEEVLDNFCDLSRMCAQISNSTILPKELINIADNSRFLLELSELTLNLSSSLLKVDKEMLDKTLELSENIRYALKDSPNNDPKEGGILKTGYDAELDYLRNQYDIFKDEISTHERQQAKRCKKQITLKHSSTIGYYFEVVRPCSAIVPQDWFLKNSTSKISRYSTKFLEDQTQKINNLSVKINALEYELFCELRKKASDFTQIIRILAKDIAKIDVFASLAKCAILNDLTKPEYSKQDIIIKDGYHPSLIKLKNEIIKNSTELKDGSMIVLTGANMSGKSTYLKYNAIISLLFQIGSFVPATSAKLSIVDSLFFRQGSTDDIINNNSSFMVEMNDLKFIIDNATNSSLILLDEPAKSTNAQEGGAIARAFCEYILTHFKAKTIVVTHNPELTKLEGSYPDLVKNYTIGSSERKNSEFIDRKIKRGTSDTSLAINTALLADIPNEIIDKAKEYM